MTRSDLGIVPRSISKPVHKALWQPVPIIFKVQVFQQTITH